MPGVTGDDPGEGPHRDAVAAGDAAPSECFVVEAAEQIDRRDADVIEFRSDIRERSLLGVSAAYEEVLVKTGKFCSVSAAEAEGTIREDPLRVGDVAKKFAYAPLPFRVAVRGLFLGDRAKKAREFLPVVLQRGDDVTIQGFVDVSCVVGRVFVWIGACGAVVHVGSCVDSISDCSSQMVDGISMIVMDRVKELQQRGFALFEACVHSELASRAAAAVEEVIAPIESGAPFGDDIAVVTEGGRAFVTRINLLHRHLLTVSLAIAGSPGLREIGRSICGDDYLSTYEAAVIRTRGDGQTLWWHQDMVHDRTSPIVTVGVNLLPSPAAASVRIVPGTQHEPQRLREFHRGHEAVTFDLAPGDVLVHDVMVVHGTTPLVDADRRLTLYVEFRTRASMEANFRFPSEWLDARTSLQELERAVYGGKSLDDGDLALIERAYRDLPAVEPANY